MSDYPSFQIETPFGNAKLIVFSAERVGVQAAISAPFETISTSNKLIQFYGSVDFKLNPETKRWAPTYPDAGSWEKTTSGRGFSDAKLVEMNKLLAFAVNGYRPEIIELADKAKLVAADRAVSEAKSRVTSAEGRISYRERDIREAEAGIKAAERKLENARKALVDAHEEVETKKAAVVKAEDARAVVVAEITGTAVGEAPDDWAYSFVGLDIPAREKVSA